ncbi:MAG: transporter [Agriterribacter sp.]
MISCISLLSCIKINAQLKGIHTLSDAGLQSGSQASPSFTLAIPVYTYHTSTLVSGKGNKIDAPAINLVLTGISTTVVTSVKILGGNYGASVFIPFAASRIEGELVSSKSSLAFTDMYIQPVQLGWKVKQADFICSYALYLPTGKYEWNGSNNTGLGMFTNEFSTGSTAYFDEKKQWHFSALLSYALNSKKKNTKDNSIKVGNLLSVEGGIGKTWYKPVKNNPLPMIINIGLVYYIQFKTSDDKMKIPALGNTAIDLGRKDKIFGLGAEANIFIPAIKSSAGIRWETEMGARNRTQGNSFFITIAPYIRFFAPKKK